MEEKYMEINEEEREIRDNFISALERAHLEKLRILFDDFKGVLDYSGADEALKLEKEIMKICLQHEKMKSIICEQFKEMLILDDDYRLEWYAAE